MKSKDSTWLKYIWIYVDKNNLRKDNVSISRKGLCFLVYDFVTSDYTPKTLFVMLLFYALISYFMCMFCYD